MTEQVDEHFVASVRALAPGRRPPAPLGPQLLELFDAQLGSRHLDLVARELRARGVGYYTIGSSGHEGNAAVAAALRPTDPALLHYRSGAFYLERMRQLGRNGLLDVLLGMMAAIDEPIAGGRHKVFGHPDAAVIPQTSTIASHLPRALGVAFAIDRARKLGVAGHVAGRRDRRVQLRRRLGQPLDRRRRHQRRRLHGVPGPAAAAAVRLRGQRHSASACRHRRGGSPPPAARGRGCRYFHAGGFDPCRRADAAGEAVECVRRHRKPAFLHLRTVRLMGHAGSDAEIGLPQHRRHRRRAGPRPAAGHRAKPGRRRAS